MLNNSSYLSVGLFNHLRRIHDQSSVVISCNFMWEFWSVTSVIIVPCRFRGEPSFMDYDHRTRHSYHQVCDTCNFIINELWINCLLFQLL